MQELPKVFKNNIEKKFNNNNCVYYSCNDNRSNNNIENINDNKNIVQKINEIFSSPNYVYQANVEIKLKDKTIKSRIIGRNKDYIITMENSLIPINEIKDIKSLKKLKMILLAGVCGDLCVMDFGRTLLRYLDEINHDLKVFVVKSCIDTFDAPGHNREEWLDIAYKVLEQAGAVVVEDVDDLKGKVKQLIK